MSELKFHVPQFSFHKRTTTFEKVHITSSLLASEFARKLYDDTIEIYESFFVVLCDNSNNAIGYAQLSSGGITGVIVDIRLLCHYVIISHATSVILVHNHPSGNLKPSEADIRLTRAVTAALNNFDVTVSDHIILTSDSYFSFSHSCLL